MTNKYLEKIAGMGSLASGLGKKVAVGAALGGATGAIAGGENNRVKGALAGAVAGGVAGSVFGRKALDVSKSSNAAKQLTTFTGHPNVSGFSASRGTSSLAKKMKNFTDV
jgi:hypothetical protein